MSDKKKPASKKPPRDRYGVRKRSTKNMKPARKSAYRSRKMKGRNSDAAIHVFDREKQRYLMMPASKVRRLEKNKDAFGTKADGARYKIVSRRTFEAGTDARKTGGRYTTKKGYPLEDGFKHPREVVKDRQARKARKKAAPSRSPNSKTGDNRGPGKPTKKKSTAKKSTAKKTSPKKTSPKKTTAKKSASKRPTKRNPFKPAPKGYKPSRPRTKKGR